MDISGRTMVGESSSDNDTRLAAILKKATGFWDEAVFGPDYVAALRQALLPPASSAWPTEIAQAYRQLLELPILCGEALGRRHPLAETVTASWLLLYAAAHHLDSVEDEEIIGDISRSVLTNTATGLLATASLVLNELGETTVAREIQREFHQTVLRMCAGQHTDLTRLEPSLDATPWIGPRDVAPATAIRFPFR
jgi:hypothetical protein